MVARLTYLLGLVLCIAYVFFSEPGFGEFLLAFVLADIFLALCICPRLFRGKVTSQPVSGVSQLHGDSEKDSGADRVEKE